MQKKIAFVVLLAAIILTFIILAILIFKPGGKKANDPFKNETVLYYSNQKA
ncbi:MAG: hypothetical protein H7Y00_00685, partial [Fimbriimonadaceae bacterium]|nr:hypothetical protein [Chitinophagales bacterium]